MVLLHGFGGVHAVWDAVADDFAETNTVIAYDLPGHGGSLAFAGGSSARSAARAVLADLTSRGAGRAHVVGHSLGGAVATLMAAMQPSAVITLTLLAPGGFGEQINGAALQNYARAVTGSELQTALGAMSAPGATVAPQTLSALETMRRANGQIEKLVDIATAISADDRQGTFPPAMIAGLEMPVSVLWGTADPVLTHDESRLLPPSFRLTLIDDVGHMLIEESPAAVVDAIRASVSGK